MRLACSIRVPHYFDAVIQRQSQSLTPKDHSHWGRVTTLGGKHRIRLGNLLLK